MDGRVGALSALPTKENRMSALLEIRQKFIELSGRRDLATTDTEPFDEDAGADWFINNGSRWLDLHQEHLNSTQEFQEGLAIGEWYLDMEALRVPKAVWTRTALGVLVKLKNRSFDWMLANYPELGSTTPGTPAYWSSFIAHRAPEQVGSGLEMNLRRVAIMPPTDSVLTMVVYGRFFQLQLSDNDDENFWSSEHPDLLVLAALMSLEGFYRNTQGVADYRNMIEDILIVVDKDTAEASDQEPHRMEG